MSLRALRPPRTPLVAVLQLVLCAVAIVCAAPLMQIGWGCEYLYLPEWQALLAQVGVVALLLVAIWQFVLAAHDRPVRSVLWGFLQVAAAVVCLIVILYTGTGYAAALLVTGIAWLEVIRRTWPRPAFRAPRLRDAIFEPPARGWGR